MLSVDWLIARLFLLSPPPFSLFLSPSLSFSVPPVCLSLTHEVIPLSDELLDLEALGHADAVVEDVSGLGTCFVHQVGVRSGLKPATRRDRITTRERRSAVSCQRAGQADGCGCTRTKHGTNIIQTQKLPHSLASCTHISTLHTKIRWFLSRVKWAGRQACIFSHYDDRFQVTVVAGRVQCRGPSCRHGSQVRPHLQQRLHRRRATLATRHAFRIIYDHDDG